MRKNDKNWIAHHGVEGQKWGVRRYQNKDGSLTSAGKKHRTLFEEQMDRKIALSKADDKLVLDKRSQRRDKYSNKMNAKIKKRKEKNKDVTKLKDKKKRKLDKFDSVTESIKAGQHQYNKTLEEYRDATVKTFKDASYKKNPQYKRAVANYGALKLNDLLGSSRSTKQGYASGNSNVANLASDVKERYEDEKWWREH